MDADSATSGQALHPESIMLRDVLEGLSRAQKELSPKYFYDETGSELFECITQLDAYYPTRTERTLLEDSAAAWVRELAPGALVELGAGRAEKSRVLLSAMETHRTGSLYVPVDVSADFLHETARRLRQEYDAFRVEPAVVDISEPFHLPRDLPTPTWIALLGSTLGNFRPEDALHLLQRVRTHLRSDDRFLLGVDLRPGPGKSVEMLEAAYNDDDGVTARFNLNVLAVLNRELGADFDTGRFQHRAFYEPRKHRIEMHLVALVAHAVDVAGTRITFEEGESIRTEISCKYDRGSIDELFARSDLRVERWTEDERGRFALLLAAPSSLTSSAG